MGDRFSNAHSYLQNNPPLKGRLKKYNPTRNVDHFETMNKLKKSKTVSCLNILRNRSKNKNLVIDDKKDNIFFHKKITTHNLSKINNKSSNCITPGFFNPLINYKAKEKKIANKKNEFINKSKDHFYHMNPTELYRYKPILKRTKINYNLSQISSLPGNTLKNNIFGRKKSGKKMFEQNNKESKELISRNQCRNKNKYLCNTTNTFWNQNVKKYEFDDPMISCENIKSKKN